MCKKDSTPKLPGNQKLPSQIMEITWEIGRERQEWDLVMTDRDKGKNSQRNGGAWQAGLLRTKRELEINQLLLLESAGVCDDGLYRFWISKSLAEPALR